MKQSLTKLEQEKLSKRNREEAKEELAVYGQENEKNGAKWVKEYVKKLEKNEWDKKQFDLEVLSKLRSKKRRYFRFLSHIFLYFVKDEAIPSKYRIDVDINDEGLACSIRGTSYYGAFAPTGIPHFDRHACKILAVKLGNTIAKLEGYVRVSEGGVIIPDSEDLQYGRRNPVN